MRKAVKAYRRSFRFDEETNQILEDFEGSNLSEKFDNLVRRSYLELPAAEKRLADIETLIEERRGEFSSMNRYINAMESLMYDVARLKNQVETIVGQAQRISPYPPP